MIREQGCCAAGLRCALGTQAAPQDEAPPSVFKRDLQFGDRGRDVRKLQSDVLFVKSTGCVVPLLEVSKRPTFPVSHVQSCCATCLWPLAYGSA